MKRKKLTRFIIAAILVTLITVLQPLITFSFTVKQKIAALATQVTVHITGPSQGSGVIIKRNGNIYTVLTNSHVFQYGGKFEIVTQDSRKHQLNNLWEIPDLDLATLQFKSNQEYRVVELANSKDITIGQEIYVRGFPANQDFTLLPSTISRILKQPRDGGYSLVYRIGAFPGMSGGPILDNDGKLLGIHGQTQSVPVWPGPSTTEEFGIPIQSFLDISSVSYTKLGNLLKAQSFKEADIETERIMLAVVGREHEGWLRIEDTENFPCKELGTINALWLKFSMGKFGFSVQQEIYHSLGGTKEMNWDIWRSLGDRVGWRQGGSWVPHDKLIFSLSAPVGQLPGWLGSYKVSIVDRNIPGASLLHRYMECKQSL